MDDFPGFSQFYEEVHGFEPFPWQSRLAAEVLEKGRWPAAIDVATGLGKTSAIDIAIWSLASDLASRGPQRRFPNRIWYVVNRRLLVDAAYERSRMLQCQLRCADSGAIGAIAEALSAGQAVKWDVGPLHVTRLRGGADRGARTPDPSCPAIVLSTVAMYGSRLLFRGYGTTAGSRPIDAAHAGTDTLLLLDEAHLARPLQTVMQQITELPAAAEPVLRGSRSAPVVVNLSATGTEKPDFQIDELDEAHEVVSKRLHAAKPTQLSSDSDKKIPELLAQAAVAAAESVAATGRAPATVVFVNTARRAPTVRAALEKALKHSTFVNADIRTLTGRIRPYDATALREELLGGTLDVSSKPKPLNRLNPLFVVATQTLEVGADLDFDCLITESAGSRALVQRFGRLNRLGVRPWAVAHIVHADDLQQWPVYGSEPGEVWGRLLDALGLGQGLDTIDLGPAHIADVIGAPADDPPASPELLPNFLREWAKTSAPKSPWIAPVEPFIMGEQEALRTATVLWREMLPADDAESHLLLRPLVHSDEAIDIPVGELQQFVGEGQAWRLDANSGGLERVESTTISVGDTIILPSTAGGYYQDGGWSPSGEDPVPDLSARLRNEFVLTGVRIRDLCAEGMLTIAPDQVDATAHAADQHQLAWSNQTWLSSAEGHDGDDLESVEFHFGDLISTRRVRGGPVVAVLPTPARSVQQPRVEAEDELSTISDIGDSRSTLRTHLDLVGRTAGQIATTIGLPQQVVASIELAGRLHDVGKADPRFQMLLGNNGEHVMAKSLPDQRGSGPNLWPRGARHEAASGLLFHGWLAKNGVPRDVDVELAMHLVLSHHGYGRPLVPAVTDSAVVSTRWEIEGTVVTADVDLDQADWDQPGRFERLNTKYGYWGLALLESVVRQADHAESSLASDEGVLVMEVH